MIRKRIIFCGKNGNEFIRKVRRLARRDGVVVVHEAAKGKGSHGRLYYASRFTTIKDPRKEIGIGLRNKMLRDLGIDVEDFTRA